eukprot:1891808-Alexandrium_andersonii.AAC.1
MSASLVGSEMCIRDRYEGLGSSCEVVRRPGDLCTPRTFVRGRTEVWGPLYEVAQRSGRLCTRPYKGPGACVRGRTQ